MRALTLAQLREYLLCYCFEGIEHPGACRGYRFDHWFALLTELCGQFLYGKDVWQIALIKL